MYFRSILITWAASGLYLGTIPVGAQVETLRLGKDGIAWRELADLVVSLDESPEREGALQSQRLLPDQNLLVGVRTENNEPTNQLGQRWFLEKGAKDDFIMGVNPRFWTGLGGGTGGKGPQQLIDGDPNSVTKVITVFAGAHRGEGFLPAIFTFDLGVPVPINRIVFFPPDNGVDEERGLKKQRFPRAYEVSAQLVAEPFLLLDAETQYHTLQRTLQRTLGNSERVTRIDFPTELFRFLRLSFNLADQKYLLGEIQVFGEGFLPLSTYRTVAISMDEPVNFGRISWDMETFRQEDLAGEAVPDPDAPVELLIQTRTGRDQTPDKFHILDQFGVEEEVDEEGFQRAPQSSLSLGPRPGDRASVVDDLELWSPWSSPYNFPGDDMRSPDGRGYMQIRFEMRNGDFHTFGRLHSLSVEYSPLQVEELVGEVGLAGVEEDEERPLEVPVGVDTTFVYDLEARFGPDGRLGFDAIRLNTFADVEFVQLEMGAPLEPITPDSTNAENGLLSVYFPSHKIVRASGSERLRLVFRTSLLSFSSFFLAEVFEIDGTNLAQSVDPGDVNPLIGSNDIQVFASDSRIDLLAAFDLSSPVLTPNGDGVNDVVQLDLHLLGVEAADTVVEVYALTGERVRRLVQEQRSKGVHLENWDGRDDDGQLVAPGIYLLRVQVDADQDPVERIRTISVVY
ncbi:MAG: hypothetical protein GKR89_18230 [Candidatus Latescibacteria bacterium]|nr:hypothetical protein [Candidatus Latescibacterota bacterium]